MSDEAKHPERRAGQRWRCDMNGIVYTLTEYVPSARRWNATFPGYSAADTAWLDDPLWQRAGAMTLLADAPATPQPSAPVVDRSLAEIMRNPPSLHLEPADAATVPRCAASGSSCEDTGDPAMFCDIEQESNVACAPGRCALRAAPPVSGDEDESAHQIAAEWGACDFGEEGGSMHSTECDISRRAYAAGLERGRALGAREENKTCETLALDVADKCEKRRGYCGDDGAAAEEIADKIATRRTREGTNGQ
jgi:hypothetical protein